MDTPPVAADGDRAASIGGRAAHAAFRASAASPFLALVVSALVPGYLDPMLANPPGVLGLPLGVVILALTSIVALLGFEVVRRSPSSIVRVVALAVLTLPALVAVVMSPMVIRVIIDLA